MFVAAFMGMSNATMVLTASLYFQDLSPEIENIYPYVAFGFSLIAISGLLTQLFLRTYYLYISFSFEND